MRFGFIARFLSVFLIAFLVSGCVSTTTEKRTQTIKVNTNPPGAQVWVGDESGQKEVGQSPVSVVRYYSVEEKDFNNSWWWTVAGSVLLGLAGVAIAYSAESDRSAEAGTIDDPQVQAGFAVIIAGSATALITTILCLRGYIASGSATKTHDLTIGVNLDGYLPKEMNLQIPSDQEEVSLLLTRAQTTENGTSPLATNKKGPDPKREIVAVFDINDTSRKLDKDVLVQLTVYLSTVLAQTGKYQVVPRDQLRKRLLDEKKGTYKSCYDESCQIELGKTLAAQKTLATTLIQIGTKCAVTANLFDLKNETAEKGAAVETGCETEELLGAMKQIAQQLSK